MQKRRHTISQKCNTEANSEYFFWSWMQIQRASQFPVSHATDWYRNNLFWSIKKMHQLQFVFVWSNVCILKIKERGKISKVSITHLSALTDSLLARKLTLSNKHKVLRVFGHSPKYWANWNLIWLWCYKKSQLLKRLVGCLKVPPRGIMIFHSKPWFTLWAPWMSVPNFTAVHSIEVKTF